MSLLLLVLALTVSDGQNTRPQCTSYTFDSASGALTLSPLGCIGTTAPTPPDSPADYEPFVKATYVQFLGREADPAGLAFWTQWLYDNRAVPGYRQQFLDSVYNSPEAIAYRASQQPPAPVPGGVTAAQFFGPPNTCTIGGGTCGSVSSPAVMVPLGNCGSGMGTQITTAYQLNLLGDFFGTFPGHAEHTAMAKGNVISFMFQTGARPTSCSPNNPGCLHGFNASSSTIGTEAPTFMSVSTLRCDFDYAKVNTSNGCYRSIGGSENGVTTRFGPAGMPPDGSCDLAPNTSYFVNIRWEDVTGTSKGKESCTAVPPAKCGMAIDFR